MSENVEIVRRWLVAMSAGAEEWQAAISEVVDADIDYYPVRKFPDVQPRHGHAEIVNFMLTFVRDWEHVDYESKRIIPVGDDRVLVHGAFHAEGHETRLPLQGDIYHCVWLRNGRILRWEDHLTEAGALDALGVSRASLDTAEPDGDGS